jgi:putative endonuclease
MKPAVRQAFVGNARADLGRRAEALTVDLLEQQGFRIIGRNVRVGRLELDIIAQKCRLLVFCEVRARSNDRWISPAQTIDGKKQRRIRQAAARWLSQSKTAFPEIRFDAASVVFDVPQGRVTYYESAF